MSYDLGPYDPCPCGSGDKYKFCCAAKAKANRHGKFPIGTVAYYGPDDKVTTKVVAGVVLREWADPIIERWVGTGVAADPKIGEEVKRFFARHGVKSIVVTDGNLGCPHEEGPDFPVGQDCPFCPFWAGKQGTAQRHEGASAAMRPPAHGGGDGGAPAAAEWPEARDFNAFARMEAVLAGRGSGAATGDDVDDAGKLERDEGAEDDEDNEDNEGDEQGRDFEESMNLLLEHLRANLRLPCEVTGIEDFQWEERYVIGGWPPAEYKRLKQSRPSYKDRYELLEINRDEVSRWMMCGDDIAARVRRISDGQLFVLGLSELKTTDEHSPNHQLLADYVVWFLNSR